MIGSKLRDRYELTEVLGRGGMGVVYRAYDPMLERQVAIKLIPPTSLAAEGRTRFRREARMVARLDHPAIVAIHDFGTHDDDILFIVMPLVEGKTLRHHIARRDLTVDDILEIGFQVADALDYSHRHGVIHRDIKPENIMISRPPGGIRVRVMDFGLARLEGHQTESAEPTRSTEEMRLTGSGGFIGTVAYMSPEQIDGRELDGKIDLYALGAVLYEVLCGDPPFGSGLHSAMYRIVHEPPASLHSRGVELGDALDALLLSCLAKEPQQRPEDGRDVADRLQWIRGRLSQEVLNQPVVMSTERRRRHGPASPPLVGRQEEMAALGARLDAALQGECQWVMVAGETGVGKTRLLEELDKLATVRGMRVLHGRFAESHTALPYHGLCDLVQDYARSLERDGSVAVDLSDLAADLVQYFPMLSDLPLVRQHVDSRDAGQTGSFSRSSSSVPYGAGVPARNRPSAEGRTATGSDNDSSGLPADWEAMTLFEVLARTLARIGNGQPLVLLLEHLHAGDVSLEALSYIVRRLGATPTLIVGTYRPSEVDRAHPLQRLMQSFYDDSRWLHIHLQPLERRAFRQLLAACTQEQPSEALLDRLYEATEGNPLFALELLRAMDKEGDLAEHTSSLWQFGGGIASGSLPATIQQAVQRRIDRLPHQQRQWLSVAAVIGRTFEVDALQHLLRQSGEEMEEDELDDFLDQLIDDGVLQEEPLRRGDHLRFSSGIIADVLYRDLSRRRRRRLHRIHGAYLEDLHRGRLEPALPQLVRHFSAGDVPDKTVHYGVQLARDSLKRFSFEDAIRAARTALELAEEDVLEDAEATRGELHWLLAQAERASGNLERAQHEAAGAWRAADQSQNEAILAKIALFQAETAWQARQAREARRWIERGIEVARHAELPGILHRLLTFGATLANLQGQTDLGQSYLEESARLAPDKTRSPDTPRGGVLRTALRVPITSLSPGSLWVDDAIEVLGNVFETLLKWDTDGNLVRGLAESWRSDSRHRRFVFQLRPGIRFSDGTVLNAESVRTSMLEAMKQDPTSPIAAFRALRLDSDGSPAIEVVDARQIAFELQEPLPIFPALLTDLNTAIQRPRETLDSSLGPLGSGPFVVEEADSSSLRLSRNGTWWRREGPSLDGIVFELATSSDTILQRLLHDQLDLGRDLAPHHLDEALRDSRFRSRRVEVVKKNIYFVLWNDAGPLSRLRDLRRLASSVLQPQDLVWRTLGRAAQPAVSFIPPGVLGHDAGRRRSVMGLKEAQQELTRLPLASDATLRCVVHPVLADRFRPLCEAIFELWRGLGLQLEILGDSMEAYQEAYRGNDVVDVLLGRWNADYEDPDNFTYGLFHGRGGRFSRFYHSPITDRWLEEARQEVRSQRRIELYRRFEDHLQEESLLVPLMHDINDRLAAPRVIGLQLTNTAPYVNYDSVALRPLKAKETATDVTGLTASSVLHVPVHGQLKSLDPVLSRFVESVEVTPNVFETLTRYEDGARVVPWLAESVEDIDEGRCYRIRLRPQVRFHDGRRLTTRDVRYSFERALVGASTNRIFPMLPIRGSRALQEGQAEELAGLHIESSSELLLELDEPLSAFPALLSFPSAAIVPEGCTCFDASWRRGCVGTGPFRVVELDEHQLVLDRNTDYWRPRLPRSERLVFHFGMTSEQAYEAFRAGRLSLVSDLRPRHVERLRRDPRLAMGYRESPRLATYFLVLNSRQGVFRDIAMRRRFIAGLQAGQLVRHHAARLMVPATGLIPPGLLGYEERRLPKEEAVAADTVVALRAVVLPAFQGPYREFWDQLKDRMLQRGWDVESEVQLPGQAINGEAEFMAFRWVADYPDTDGFLGRLLHSDDGVLADYCRSSEIDQLLNAGRRSSDARTRHALYRQVEELVIRDALILPLFHEQMYRFHGPQIKGFRFGLHMPEVCYEELYAQPEISSDVD